MTKRKRQYSRRTPLRITRYTEEQWREIKTAVRGGLKRDAVTTKVIRLNQRAADYQRLGCDEPLPSGATLMPGQVMLRTALQRLLVDVSRPGPPPPSLPELRRLKGNIDKLGRRSKANPHMSVAAPGLEEASRSAARVIEDIGPNPQRLNAANRLRDWMVFELLDIWTGLGGKLTDKHTVEFLRACLEPVFGKDDEDMTEALKRSLDRLRGSLEWFERFEADEAVHDDGDVANSRHETTVDAIRETLERLRGSLEQPPRRRS